jgi:hypothetical protein
VLPEKFADTTLIGDTTHFPINAQRNDEYKGENSVWSYKIKKPGICFHNHLTGFCEYSTFM